MGRSYNRDQVTIFVALFVGYTLYVLCRKAFTLIIPVISQQEPISKSELGLIVSAQNLASAGSKFFLGILSDSVSPRVMFCTGLLGASFSVLGFCSVSSVALYTSLWFLNGLAQGCGWPACGKLLQQWYRPEQFGTYWSVLSASVNVAGGIVPLILPFLLHQLGGWRAFMFSAGILSLLWGVVSFLLITDSPAVASGTNFKKDSQKPDQDDGGSMRFRTLLKSPFLWILSFNYLVIYGAKTGCENWGQLLVQEKGLPPTTAGFFLSAFETGGFISSLATGYIADWAVARNGMNLKRNPRLKVVLVYTVFCVILTHLVTVSSSLLPFLGFLLGAALYGNINIFGILAMECAPKYLSGTSHAFVALASNLGAVFSGLPLSLVANRFGWTGSFYLMEMMIVLCAVSMLLSRNVSTKIESKED